MLIVGLKAPVPRKGPKPASVADPQELQKRLAAYCVCFSMSAFGLANANVRLATTIRTRNDAGLIPQKLVVSKSRAFGHSRPLLAEIGLGRNLV